jgi:hypothetical protein
LLLYPGGQLANVSPKQTFLGYEDGAGPDFDLGDQLMEICTDYSRAACSP